MNSRSTALARALRSLTIILVLVLVVVPDQGCTVTPVGNGTIVISGLPGQATGTTGLPLDPTSTSTTSTGSLNPGEATTSTLTQTSNAQQIQVVIAAANTTEVAGQAYDPANASSKLLVGLYRATATTTEQPLATATANLDPSDGVTVSPTGNVFRISVAGLNLQAGEQVFVRAFSPTDTTQFQTSSPVAIQGDATTTTGTTTAGLPTVGTSPDPTLAGLTTTPSTVSGNSSGLPDPSGNTIPGVTAQ